MKRRRSKASGPDHAHDQNDDRRRNPARWRLARNHGDALSGGDRQARTGTLVRGFDPRDHASDRTDGRIGSEGVSAGEPVSQYREVRERQARSVYAEADEIRM